MTKKVRIENADTSNHPVRVTVQDKNGQGEWATNHTVQLDFPTAMSEQYIHSTRRIVIEERAADPVLEKSGMLADAPVQHQPV